MAMMGWFGLPRRGIAATPLLLVTVWVILVADVHCQLPRGISADCLSAFAKHNSTATGRACLLTFAQNIGIRPRNGRGNRNFTAVLTEGQLESACGSQDCLDVFVEIVEACETEFRSALSISDAVDLDDLLQLRCLKDNNGEFCYHELEGPILTNPNSNPMLVCNLRTPRQLCSDDCKAALSPFASSCCMVSYLYVAAGDSRRQQRIATVGLWRSCNLTAPDLCPTISSNAQPNTDNDNGCVDNDDDDDDDDDDDKAGRVVVAVIGGLIFIALVAILVVLIIHLVLKYRTSRSASYSVKDEMKVQFASEGHVTTQ